MSRLSRFLPKFLRGDKHQQADVGDKSVCRVILLDETEFKLPYKGSLRGQYILDKVFDQLNLLEKDYFCVRYLDNTGQTHWLDNLKTLSSQLKGCNIPYTFYFGVKFYAADPCKLREEITRYLFFLQVKQDVLHGRLPVSFEDAVELFAYAVQLSFEDAVEVFAYAVQSEIGDYDSQRLVPGYISEFQFVPNQTEELEEQIAAIHRRLGGTIPATAELKFLDKVKWLDMYGVDLHPVLGEGNTEYFLGLTPTGIVVYKNKTKVGNYFWPRITKVNFKAKVFIVKVRDKINDEHTYAFELVTKAACKHLWKCCVEHHAFFRLNQLGEASSKAGKPFRSVSKHRSGRQDRQNNADQSGREQPRVLRVPSRRQARRAISDPRLNGDATTGIQYTEGHITMVVTPEQVKGPRHRSLPDLKGRESPTSTRSAPWETNRDTGLYTSGRESPSSVTQSENVRHYRNRDSDSESGYRKNYRYGYDSDGGHVRKHNHHRSNHWSGFRQSGYESDPHSVQRRKYFPSSRKGSDNESDVSFSRRRRREVDSGSESDVSPKHAARQRQNKGGPDRFERQWQIAMQSMYLPDKENRPNGSIPSIHSAPGGEARQKKQRRRRSKSPNTRRPPEELRQHIEFDLVDPVGFTEEQLREIPFTNVETKADAFKVKYSPKTRQRYRSPKRKSTGETDTNGNIKGYKPDDAVPPYSRTLERTPEPVHRSRTPERTPEPKHRINLQPSGHFSDGNPVPSSVLRSHNVNTGPVTQQSLPYNKNFNNVIPQHNKSLRNNVRSMPHFHANLFYQPPSSVSPRILPGANVFKPIDTSRQDDSSSSISHNVNSTPELPNKQNDRNELNPAADGNFDLQGHANVGQGQVQEEEEDRNQDSGLNSSLGNSSYGSGSAVVNTPPRGRGQIYGTQDAIARLYSSPSAARGPHPMSQGNQPGRQPVDQTGSRNQGHQIVSSEQTAFRNYQSNTFPGQNTYNPPVSQYDGRPNPPVSQYDGRPNPPVSQYDGRPNPPISQYDGRPKPPLPQYEGRPNLPVSQYDRRPNPPVTQYDGRPNPPVSQYDGRPNPPVSQYDGIHNPPTSQYDGRPDTSYSQVRPQNYPHADNISSDHRYNSPNTRYRSPPRTSNQPVTNDGHSNIHQQTAFTNYPSAKNVFYNQPTSQTDSQYTDNPSQNRAFNEPQNRSIPNGPSISQNNPYQNSNMFYSQPAGHTTESSTAVLENGPVQPSWQYVGNGNVPSATQSQGYTPSSYQQRAPLSANNSYKRSPGSSPVKANSTVARQHTPEKSQSRIANQSMNISMTSSPRTYRSPDSAIGSLSSNQMSNQSSPQRTLNFTQSPQKGTPDFTRPSPQKGVASHLSFNGSPTKVGATGYAKERLPAFGQSDRWTEL